MRVQIGGTADSAVREAAFRRLAPQECRARKQECLRHNAQKLACTKVILSHAS